MNGPTAPRVRRVSVVARFSRDLCGRHPGSVYVFGDNLLRRGTAGQACIRGLANAFGIPTKRAPSMSNDAFFADRPDEFAAVDACIDELIDRADTSGAQLVFPKDGLGTGLAQMPWRSPLLFGHLCERLRAAFGLSMTHSGVMSDQSMHPPSAAAAQRAP